MDRVQTVLKKIFQPYKGILAADARPSSMDKRLEEYGIVPGKARRDAYREMLFSTPNFERTISGVILSEDTFSGHATSGMLTREYLHALGVVVGVKVDTGLQPYDADPDTLFVTTGLDNLSDRCSLYHSQGAGFVKWRAKIPVFGATDAFLSTIATDMALYANTALRHDLVPILEPEVLLEGDHTAEDSAETLRRVLLAVLAALRSEKCDASRCILKTSFVTDGLSRAALSADVVAKKTLSVFRAANLDAAQSFYGIVFLSGGLPSEIAIEYIQRIKAIAEQEDSEDFFSRPLTFSYARALQMPALQVWQGREDCVLDAQILFTQTLQHAIKKYKGAEEAPLGSDGKIDP